MTIILPTPVLDSHAHLIIAIIGGAGHIGSAVVQKALEEGHTVLALDRPSVGVIPPQPRYSYEQLDATDFFAYRNAVRGCTALIHLAAVYNLHDDEGRLFDDILQHEVHHANVAMSFNALQVAAELGINRVVLASSVNAVGMIYSRRPRYDYVPLDEDHLNRPEGAYSLSKYICEIQADSFARQNPCMRIASLRFHWVVPTALVDRETLDHHGGAWKDLWGWVSISATADACLKGLTAPQTTFPRGHETFIIAARTTCRQQSSLELLRSRYPEIQDVRGKLNGNRSLFDSTKAERMLGWKEEGFPWSG